MVVKSCSFQYCYHFSHFTDSKTTTKRLGNMRNITWLIISLSLALYHKHINQLKSLLSWQKKKQTKPLIYGFLQLFIHSSSLHNPTCKSISLCHLYFSFLNPLKWEFDHHHSLIQMEPVMSMMSILINWMNTSKSLPSIILQFYLAITLHSILKHTFPLDSITLPRFAPTFKIFWFPL